MFLKGYLVNAIKVHNQLSLSKGDRGASQVALVVKNPPGNAGDIRDVGLIPGSERSPGGEHGNPLQYSCLENAWTEELGGLQAIGLQRVGLKQFSTQSREIILDNLGGPDWISW